MVTRYNVLLSWDDQDQVWIAYVPTLNWLSTFGETRDETLVQARDAILGYLEAAEKEGLDVPDADREAGLRSRNLSLWFISPQ